MNRIILGVVNDGKELSGMSILSLWVNLQSLKKEIETSSSPHEIAIYVVSKEKNSTFCQFAVELSENTRIIAPSDWEVYGFPPMSNGSYATYWKFDLFNNVEKGDILIYLDADAFIVGKFQLNTILNRLRDAGLKNSETLFMVPAHRPVFERVGYQNSANPYAYFNAGFMVGMNFSKVEHQKLQEIYSNYYFAKSSRLNWHDQDLINTYFGEKIRTLPFRYNISSGMLNKKNFSSNSVNYLGEEEFINVVVAHASGRILFTKRHYTYRRSILEKGCDFINSNSSNTIVSNEVLNFLNASRISSLRTQFNLCHNCFSINGVKLFPEIDCNFLLF